MRQRVWSSSAAEVNSNGNCGYGESSGLENPQLPARVFLVNKSYVCRLGPLIIT